MAIPNPKSVANALNSLFPSRRYAPPKDADVGCPEAPQEEEGK